MTRRDARMVAAATLTAAAILIALGLMGGTTSPLALWGRPAAVLLLGALAYGGRRGARRLLAGWLGLLSVGIAGGVFSADTSGGVRAVATAGAAVLIVLAVMLWRIDPERDWRAGDTDNGMADRR